MGQKTCVNCGIRCSIPSKDITDICSIYMSKNDIQNAKAEIDAKDAEIAVLKRALKIADEEYMRATSEYYNEPVPPPSSIERWMSLAEQEVTDGNG